MSNTPIVERITTVDRIDSMDPKEKDAALRALLSSAREAAKLMFASRDTPLHSTYGRLRSALAAFDPTPLDRAIKLLEDGGFVRVVGWNAAEYGCIALRERNGREIWLEPKEQP